MKCENRTPNQHWFSDKYLVFNIEHSPHSIWDTLMTCMQDGATSKLRNDGVDRVSQFSVKLCKFFNLGGRRLYFMSWFHKQQLMVLCLVTLGPFETEHTVAESPFSFSPGDLVEKRKKFWSQHAVQVHDTSDFISTWHCVTLLSPAVATSAGDQPVNESALGGQITVMKVKL